MLPAYQTRVGVDNDSFRACLATILEIPLKQIPDYPVRDSSTIGNTEWLHKYNDWLIERLHIAVVFSQHPVTLPGSMLDQVYHLNAVAVNYHAAGPETFYRYVVMKGDEVIHDPYPEDVERPERKEQLIAGMAFILLDPARASQINRVLGARGHHEDVPAAYTVRDLAVVVKEAIMHAINVCPSHAEAAKRLGVREEVLKLRLKEYEQDDAS